MRKWLLTAALAGMTPLGASAASFEGLVDYEVHDAKKQVVPIHYEVKGERLHITLDQGGGKSSTILFDGPAKVMVILIPDRKMAIKNPLPQPVVRKGETPSAKKVNFTRTGKKETIAGHDCTVYTFQDEASQADVCNVEGMGTFYLFGGRGGFRPAWEEEMRSQGLFPLRMTTKDLKNGNSTTIVATRIEKKSLPDSEFAVPSDYRVMEGFGGRMGPPWKPGTGPGPGAPVGAPGFNRDEFMKKMRAATPEERQKLLQEMREQTRGAGSKP